MAEYVAIATWTFGQTAVRAADPLLRAGHSALDAVIAGGQAVEDDPDVNSVGYGGLADAAGQVTLDACVMDGRTLNCAGVAGVHHIRHVAALARRVMEKTAHVLLVGEGAVRFAIQEGFPLENLSTPASLAQWEKIRPRVRPGRLLPNPGAGGEDDHDTVTVLARDLQGHLAGCCTTSGLAHKRPGRVGDSPIIGSGLYVDDAVGAAGATGVGEEILRAVGSLRIIEALRQGRTAQEACEATVQLVNDIALRRGTHPARVAFLALDPEGRPGACCTAGTNFHYAIARPGQIELIQARELGPRDR